MPMADCGHLFVVQADMTRLAADAFLIPCDDDVNVSGTWRSFVEPGSQEQAKEDWFKPKGVRLDDGIAFLRDTTRKGASRPDDVVGIRVLVDTVGVEDIPAMVDRSLRAIRAAADQAKPHSGRALPLIAMPILGVGQGKYPGRRAEVVRLLVKQLLEFVSHHPIDVALVLRRTSDFAAAQWARGQVAYGDACWPELTAGQLALADRLGEQAANGELSIFVGAGVSRPVGFPDWQGLLQELAGRPLKFSKKTNYPRLAQRLHVRRLNMKVADRFRTTRHALGHALLVDLRTTALVTTNYDPCIEHAAAAIHQDQPLRVLARQLAVGGSPWLLKLHGDIEQPETIILTAKQYKELKTDRHALRGVVQSLMLTSHLLFVGFGFADEDFLVMSRAVQQVRRLAKEDGNTYVGTAIELRKTPKAKRKYPELDYQHAAPTEMSVPEAARRLEILLDRVAWRSQVAGRGRASYLLDRDYQEDATEPDHMLAEDLTRLRDREAEWHNSAGAQAVRDLMDELGWRPRD